MTTNGRTALVHGFAQNSACWGPFGELLASDGRAGAVTALDAPGHGAASDHAVEDCTAAGLELRSAAGNGNFVGYSMGARLLLSGAIAEPQGFDKLVLISGTAGIEDGIERQQRRRSDTDLAERLLRVGVEEFMNEWLSMEMFAGLPPSAQFRDQRATNTASGLANSLRTCGTGSMRPVWQTLETLQMPVLCLAGENDPKYCAIASRMAEAIGPNASAVIIPDVGHAAHLEGPESTARVVLGFLAQS